MKIIRCVLCLICLLLLASCPSQNKIEPVAAADRKQLIARINDSVFCISVAVKGADYEKRFSVGTGFLIADDLIASAAHVQTKAVELANKFKESESKIVAWKRFANGEVVEFPVKIAASDEPNDLVIYRFDPQTIQSNPKLAAIAKPLVLAERLPPLGEAVFSVGYYGTYEFPFNSFGNVSMTDKNEDIVSDLTLMPGNSGAPVCSLETGEVLGVTIEVLDLGNETVRFGIARRASKLRDLRKKL